MIIFGNRLFGKVDQVPGLGYVATRFFHVDYLPLIPYEGWLVLKHEGKRWRGVKIPISARSLLIGWGRTLGVVAGVAGACMAIVELSNSRATGMKVAEMVGLSLAGFGFFAFTKLHKSCTRATYTRACQLGKFAKLSDKAMADIAAAYGEAPIAYGFQPVQTKPPTLQSTTLAPTLMPPSPAPPIPAESDAFDQIPPEQVEDIPVQDTGDAEEASIGILLAEPPRQRAEIRRHG